MCTQQDLVEPAAIRPPVESDGGEGPSTHLAVVFGGDGILAVCAATDRLGLSQQLAEYVEWNAHKLWPDDAAQVIAAIGKGLLDVAIDRYFERVGERWDFEYLHRSVIDTPWRGAAST